MLARTHFGVAENSQHIYGRALDIRLNTRDEEAVQGPSADGAETIPFLLQLLDLLLQASNLGGTSPLDARVVSTGTTAAYDFRVHPTGSVAAGSDYSVRILLRDNVVYVVRVEASKGGREALLKVVNSIRWL